MSNTIKTNYYDSFRCKADGCSLTCCQEWRIPIDEKTAEKWKEARLDGVPKNLCHYLEKEEDDYIMTLNEEKKCPFLNNEKLCKVFIELGEELLSETCIRYPRRINRFEKRTEYALDFGCPEAIDLINRDLGDNLFVEEGIEEEEVPALYELRSMMLAVLADDSYQLTERLLMLFYVLLELLGEKELSVEAVQAYETEEYFKALGQEVKKLEVDPIDTLWERNELFLDMIQNYRAQEIYVDYLEEIAQYAEGLDTYYSDAELLGKIETFEKAFLAYEGLIKNYWMSEVFASCLMEGMELKDLVVVFEWLIMAYCAMKHAIFISWLREDQQVVEYTLVRKYITVLSRVTGYEQEDILDYLENSFEDVILEWGYLALILGKERL